MIDVDDTKGCPVGDRCAVCGVERAAELVAATFTVAGLGVCCGTVCVRCLYSEGSRMPSEPLGSALERVLLHCMHLGIDLEDMAVAVEAES